ncbi:uncharacterized protein LOC144562200 [Carex rostrata]
MALSSIHSLQLGLVAPKSKPLLSQPLHLISASISFQFSIRPLFITNHIPHRRRLCAIEKSNDSSNPASEKILLEEQSQIPTQAQAQSEEKEPDSLTQVASELKQMLKEKKEREQQGDNLWIGVAQEVRQIEWPDLGKVLGLTGVVLAVIAGSTAALLSVNAILAELSDQVFAGKGIQDFF